VVVIPASCVAKVDCRSVKIAILFIHQFFLVVWFCRPKRCEETNMAIQRSTGLDENLRGSILMTWSRIHQESNQWKPMRGIELLNMIPVQRVKASQWLSTEFMQGKLLPAILI
jgi:hypothetical protein